MDKPSNQAKIYPDGTGIQKIWPKKAMILVFFFQNYCKFSLHSAQVLELLREPFATKPMSSLKVFVVLQIDV